MKNLWSKNFLIGLLFFTNVATGGYIFYAQASHRGAMKGSTVSTPLANLSLSKKSRRGKTSAFENSDLLRSCYENYLLNEPEVDQGSVLLHMTIREDGSVDYLELVESDMRDEQFTNCILHEVQKARIEPTEERMGVIISHRFKFSRNDQQISEYDASVESSLKR